MCPKMWPKLVRIAKTPIHVTIYGTDLGEYGERETVLDADLLCNYQGKAETRYTSDKQAVLVTGTALFDGDICPAVCEISGGTVVLFGETRDVLNGTKARNPDGTVNYTRLDLQ